MSIFNFFKGKIGKGANVQIGVGSDANITTGSDNEKQSIWTNALIIVAGIIIALIILSVNFLCYNKIISSKSCEKLFIVPIDKASSLWTENNPK
ncbi:MAG: hypothetical protein NTW85_05315 [Methylococcales bacterium]|nr:hypothetical protein [Methylococcales bacterium]